MSFRIAFACHQSQGKRRYQEDYALVRCPDQGLASTPCGASSGYIDASAGFLAVLADGMGGHAGGEIASETAATSFAKAYEASEGTVPGRLARSLEAANEDIAARIARERRLNGMGTTLLAVHIGNDGLHWMSVGDSPLLLLRGSQLERINADHSLAPMLDEMVASGRMSAEAARRDGRRHYLRSAVSGQEIELVDLTLEARPLQDGDLLILASDGIETLPDAEILRVIMSSGGDLTCTSRLEHCAATLLDAVDAAGDPHQDNTTLVLAKVGKA